MKSFQEGVRYWRLSFALDIFNASRDNPAESSRRLENRFSIRRKRILMSLLIRITFHSGRLRVAWCPIPLLILWIMLCGALPAAASSKATDASATAWSVELKVRNYFDSSTSYEFGNPYPPYQAPLSRLEFPINTRWVGAEVRRRFSRVSLGVEALANITGDSTGVFKDSDWDDDNSPDTLTIYSESKCRMEQSFDVRADIDLKVSDWIGLPSRLDLRPVAGVRWQRFLLVGHDGSQHYPAPGDGQPSLALPGDGIRFEQTYWHYFLGMRMTYELGRRLKEAPRVKVFMQLDWAYVDGNNEDRHLLRVGDRRTYENTRGDAWHALLGLKVGLTDNVNATLALDHLKIHTTGSHRLVNSAFDIDFSFDHGVKVWSQQTSVTVNVAYFF